jgi:integrase/recombinase XerD
MPKIFKPAGKSKYVVFYTDHNGRRRKKTLTADRRISERIAASLLEKVALRKDGLIDKRDEKFAEHEGRPLKEHLDDYARVIAANGATERHVDRLVFVIGRVLDLARAKYISDLSLSSVEEAIGEIRKTKSTGTVNTYIQRVKSFNRWLWRDKRTREYLLADLHRKDARDDRRHVRRRLTDEEVASIIAAAERGEPTQAGLSGPDRAMLYRVAHGTGFRAKELRTLTPERFRLDVDPPTITVLACYSKNRQQAVQPIAESLADRLRLWLADKPAGRPVFEGMSIRTAEMLRVDLKAAGVPYETSEGIADFHSSRGTYISNLVSGGASVKTCQTLARHADPSLTIGIYAKTSLHDVKGAVETLPDIAPIRPTTEAMAATGTDDYRVHPESATQSATRGADADQSDSRNTLRIAELRNDGGGEISVRDRRFDPLSGRKA